MHPYGYKKPYSFSPILLLFPRQQRHQAAEFARRTSAFLRPTELNSDDNGEPETLSPSNLSGFLWRYSLTLFPCLNHHRSVCSMVTQSHRSATVLQPIPSPSTGSNRGCCSRSRDHHAALKAIAPLPSSRTRQNPAGVEPKPPCRT
jgi:hypothetical protein